MFIRSNHAINASFASVNVSGKGIFGSIESKGSMLIRGPLTVYNDISARNLNLTGKLTAGSASLGATTASSVTASGAVTGSDVRTSSGASLNSLKTGFVNHEGRIVSMEWWIASCKKKQVAECNR